MRPIEFLVLAVLADGKSHGYGLVQGIADRTDGRVDPKPGNLYRVLDRLLERGLVRECDEPDAGDADDGRRRYYATTEMGRAALAEEARLLGTVIDHVRSSLPDRAG